MVEQIIIQHDVTVSHSMHLNYGSTAMDLFKRMLSEKEHKQGYSIDFIVVKTVKFTDFIHRYIFKGKCLLGET